MRLNIGSKELKQNNLTTLIYGSSGSGKDRDFIIPSILNEDKSMIIVDDYSHTLYGECADKLKEAGYKVTLFDPYKKDTAHYNPLSYIEDENDVIAFVDMLIKSTSKPSERSLSASYYTKSEKLLLSALIMYQMQSNSKDEQNFGRLVELLTFTSTEDKGETPLDQLFTDLKKRNPKSSAVKMYEAFKTGTSDTIKATMLSAAARLAAFNIQLFNDATSTDDIELDKLGTEKKAIFLCASYLDTTLSFLHSIALSQAILLHRGNKKALHLYINDAYILPKVEYLEEGLKKDRNLNAVMAFQTIEQFKDIYGMSGRLFISQCDNIINMGSNFVDFLLDEAGGRDYVLSVNDCVVKIRKNKAKIIRKDELMQVIYG